VASVRIDVKLNWIYQL